MLRTVHSERGRRTNAEWIAALRGGEGEQAAALTELRSYLLRAASFTLQRARHHIGHLGASAVGALAEDCAQEALTAILQRLDTFRGDSQFTTWAYTFAVNMALVAARRQRWGAISLDGILDGTERPPTSLSSDRTGAPDPERRALQAEALAALRDGIEHHLTSKQRQLVQAVVFEEVPLDEVVRHWGSNRNALYKLLHDARRKLRDHLVARGFDVEEIVDLFGAPA